MFIADWGRFVTQERQLNISGSHRYSSRNSRTSFHRTLPSEVAATEMRMKSASSRPPFGGSKTLIPVRVSGSYEMHYESGTAGYVTECRSAGVTAPLRKELPHVSGLLPVAAFMLRRPERVHARTCRERRGLPRRMRNPPVAAFLGDPRRTSVVKVIPRRPCDGDIASGPACATSDGKSRIHTVVA